MKNGFDIRTDLAVEEQERFKGSNIEVNGVSLEELTEDNGNINISVVEILNKQGEDAMKKPIGKYVTIESYSLREVDEDYHKRVTGVLAKYINKLLPKRKNNKILVVGLGNRDATPDALGPKVISNIYINEEIFAIAPGVMAQTGIETAEYVKGIVDEIKPSAVIAIDALAARNTKRLGTTIQLSDTGINPGSGVGNHRKGINSESLGVPVVSIGVPTVVEAATIVSDAMDELITELSSSEAFKGLKNAMSQFSQNEKIQLIKELMEPSKGNLYVTPKDIDENIKMLSFTLSEAINVALS